MAAPAWAPSCDGSPMDLCEVLLSLCVSFLVQVTTSYAQQPAHFRGVNGGVLLPAYGETCPPWALGFQSRYYDNKLTSFCRLLKAVCQPSNARTHTKKLCD